MQHHPEFKIKVTQTVISAWTIIGRLEGSGFVWSDFSRIQMFSNSFEHLVFEMGKAQLHIMVFTLNRKKQIIFIKFILILEMIFRNWIQIYFKWTRHYHFFPFTSFKKMFLFVKLFRNMSDGTIKCSFSKEKKPLYIFPPKS